MRKSVKVIAYLLTVFATMVLIACGNSGNTTKSDNVEVDNHAVSAAAAEPDPVYLTVTGTSKDMNGNIVGIEKKVTNLWTSDALPNMTSMYEMYAGIQLEMDLDIKELIQAMIAIYHKDPSNFNMDSIMNYMMGSIKKTPLAVQMWALKQMKTSMDAGADNEWGTADDAIDPMLGYFLTEKNESGTYTQISYSDYGVTPNGRLDYYVADKKKTYTFMYESGSDKIYGTNDDVLVRITEFKYNAAGKILKAINYDYNNDCVVFNNMYKFTYDDLGQLVSMYSYSDPEATQRLGAGSYTELTWGQTTEGKKTLDLTIGLRIDFKMLADMCNLRISTALLNLINAKLGGKDIKFMNMHYEFNDDGTIHKLIEYESLSSKNIDTCHVYGYEAGSMLSSSKQNDYSKDYSDDEITQKALTVNLLEFGIK